MEKSNFYTIITFLLIVYIGYIHDRSLFYRTNEKYCERNKGNCKECNCWSCPRMQFLTREGELQGYKTENKINFDIIKSKIKKIFKK